MRNIYRSLLLTLTAATQKEPARYVAYLKAENKILRSRLPARVVVEPTERRRLVRLGAKLGRALDELVTIVHPGSLRRWIREDAKTTKRPRGKVGPRRTCEEIRKLILKLAKGNNWGYTRIFGELRKLNIRAVSRNTVKNILKENGFDPGPQRGHGTWDEFIKIHGHALAVRLRVEANRNAQGVAGRVLAGFSHRRDSVCVYLASHAASQ